MFSSIGWTEMMVIAVVAIIFVGPKDLPGMLRQFGRFSRKVRSMAGDFQKQVDDALRDAELDSVRDSINDVRNLDPRKAITDKLNPLKAELEADPNAQPRPEAAPRSEDTTPPVFDDDDAPGVAEPVKVDVEAALERQAEIDAAAKPAPKPKRTTAKKAAAKKPATVRKPATAKKAAPGKPRAKAKAEA